MQIALPEAVDNIISTLEANGHEAYAVGGCVRDCIMGIKPKDWDITTSAKPEEVKACFRRTIDTGIQHGTVTVMVDKEGYEVTTYRVDGEYKDGRHPESVTFTPSLIEDLKRRDFTINAMAYHPVRGLVDEFDGIGDLERGLIRCVGNPEKRFEEDALRMMRAIRFAARFGFRIEEDTLLAVRHLAPSLSKVSGERIRDEFVKTLVSDHPEMVQLFRETGLMHVFLPEWEELCKTEQNTRHHDYNVEDHTLQVLRHIKADPILRLAAFFHDIAKPICKWTDDEKVDHFTGHPGSGAEMTRRIMRRMRFDNDSIRKVSSLVRWHDERPADNERSVRRAMVKIGDEAFPNLFELKRADTMGQSNYMREEKLAAIDMFERRYREIREKKQALTVKDLAVDGEDLMRLGIAKGPELGKPLKALLEKVLDQPELNEKDKLLDLVQKMRRNAGGLLLLMVCFTFLMMNVACGSSKAGKTVPGYNTGVTVKAKDEDKSEEEESDSPIFLIQLMDQENEKLTLRNVESDRVLRYSYTLMTQFKNRYGTNESWQSFTPGRAVEIVTDKNTGVLKSVKLTDKVWEQEDVTKFSLIVDENMMTIGSTRYRILPTTEVYSDSVLATISDITDSDTLRVVGKDKDLISIIVTSGHGYIQLVNVELFKDSIMQLGDKIFLKVGEEGSRLEIPEGTYDLTLANGGYGGTQEINVARNEVTVLDLNDWKGEGPKYCSLTFRSTVDTASISLDGTPVAANTEMQVEYGAHKLSVTADGYDTWERTLVVNSSRAEIMIDPTESDSSTDNSSSNGNGTKTGTTNSATNNAQGSSSSNTTNSSTTNNKANSSNTNNTTNSGTSTNNNATNNTAGVNNSSSTRNSSNVQADYLTTLSNMVSTLMGTN